MRARTQVKRTSAIATAAAICLAFAAMTSATTIERLSLEKMAHSAPVIVRAKCKGNLVVGDAGEIWTLTSFAVEETWRGETPAQITVRLLGGRMGDITSHVSGVPQFQPGEEVVLFLEPTKRSDFSVVSWEQGTFRIRRNGSGGTQEFVTEDTAAFATFDPATRTFRASGIRNMPLDAFHARVDAALQAKEVKRP